MTANVKWYGDGFLERIRAEQQKRLTRAAITVERKAKVNLSTSGTGVMSGGRITRAIKRTRKTIYGAFPSKPGEYPHKQTGRLRGSIAWELIGYFANEMTARVGTNVKYARALWLGTSRMARRKGLEATLAEEAGTVRSILTAPWNWH